MSKLHVGSQVRVVFPVNAQGRYLPCARHMADAVEVNGQVGEVMSVHPGDGHTVGVVFMSLWHEGTPWSDYFTPGELIAQA
ncbi:MAG: hypothetical protein AB7P40_16630 [Chloroflexota bacterium]